MCGIVGGITNRDIGPTLIEGLKRLEYRGYDSAGLAIISPTQDLISKKVTGKVKALASSYTQQPIVGHCGLAHTRWATHGIPSDLNAHPHISRNEVAIVHNGIIENYEIIVKWLATKGYVVESETDSEVIAHLVHHYLLEHGNLLVAVQQAIAHLEGMYAIGIISTHEPDCVLAARSRSPLVIGKGVGGNYIASDNLALLPFTNEFIYLEEGDVARIQQDKIEIFNKQGEKIERDIIISKTSDDVIDRGPYRHFMQKEIIEQPQSAAKMLEGRIHQNKIQDEIFGVNASSIFSQVEQVTIVACGTSYHAGLVGRYWLEEIAKVPCQVEIASEYRYRHAVIKPNTLFVVLSQSGETADTISSFRLAKTQGYLSTLSICNVAESTLVREAELALLTHAGPEIGVASTKSFTSQLIALLMLTVVIGRHQGLAPDEASDITASLENIPNILDTVLQLDQEVFALAKQFIHKDNAIFLGRGSLYPIAMEGALKLKEITYIHAEAYPAGELKHGPLAIVDRNMPVIVVAPSNDLFEKLRSNLQEVKARGGELIVFADSSSQLQQELGAKTMEMPDVAWYLAPIIYTIPLQLLSYYVGVLKGTDVDQPRNLAKSVTVE